MRRALGNIAVCLMVLCIVVVPAAGGAGASEPATGVVSGEVTAAGTGHGVAGVVVMAFTTVGHYVKATVTSVGGTYALKGLAAAPADTVCFDPTSVRTRSYAGQCYRGVAWNPSSLPPAGTTPVAIRAGTTTAGVDASLRAGGTISGRVTTINGAGVMGVTVDVFGPSGTFLAAVITSAAGSYTLKGLAAAPADTVCFDPTSVRTRSYAGQCYRGVAWNPSSLPPAGTTPVAIRAGTTTAGVDASLRAGGTISGRVTTINGAGVMGVTVDVFGPSGTFLAAVITSAAGSYTLKGLPAASTPADTVCFDPTSVRTRSYAGQCYRGVAWNPSSLPAAGTTPVAIRAGTTTAGVDASLRARGHYLGQGHHNKRGRGNGGDSRRVRPERNLPGRGHYLGGRVLHPQGTARSLDPRRHGVLRTPTSVRTRSYAGQCYRGVAWNPSSLPAAGTTPVAVRAGTTTAGVDASLT